MMTQIRICSHTLDKGVIGVVADTHIPTRGRKLPSSIYDSLKDVDLILHAGDLVDDSVLSDLQVLAPVEAVAGNMDPPYLQSKLGRLKIIKINDMVIGLLHGDIGGRRLNLAQARELFLPEKPGVIVFGHLHEPVLEKEDGILFFNPGSLVDPRYTPRASYGKLYIDGNDVEGKIYYLD